MRKQKSREAEHLVRMQEPADEGKQKRERNAGDYIGVRHGDVRSRHNEAAELRLHRMYADRGEGADDGGYQGGDDRDDQRVQKQTDKSAVGKKLAVLVQREPVDMSQVASRAERADAQQYHRDIQEEKYYYGENTVKLFHIVTRLSSS